VPSHDTSVFTRRGGGGARRCRGVLQSGYGTRGRGGRGPSGRNGARAPCAFACAPGDPLRFDPERDGLRRQTTSAVPSRRVDEGEDRVVAFAPDGYTNWASIARDGSSAGRVQNLDGVRAACRGCHNQYKDKYKREMRGKII